MNVTITRVSAPPPPTDEPQTIHDTIKNIIMNLLDITDSIESFQKIVEILTDNIQTNDQIACDLLIDVNNEQANRIKEILQI